MVSRQERGHEHCGKLTPAGTAGALPLRGPISLTIALPGSCQEPIVQLKEQSLAWVK